ncbi:probable histone-lysine N-methyltransferase set-23 [Pectinophora gossypiella]|uniref:probable histone-lysine N-methyltransferase set-23 n=1 Tax=Pectinophora gossypiella TaxID=13191 RepID=UPI00214E7314|nr:probable histone-lysine N-methyltransferase set-23 [Pectinophora gossypiella]
MNDNYTHNDCSLIYIVENILGPYEDNEEYEEILNAFNSQITQHCVCYQTCENECMCILQSGGSNYSLKPSAKFCRYVLNFKGKDIKTYPIIECNSLCKCPSGCGNRVVQNGPTDRLIVKSCVDQAKGFGLYTEAHIIKGTFICEYAGEVITETEALRRHNKNKNEGKMNYIYCLKEHSNGKLTQTFVDPSSFGNIGRYMNHSCEPNCFIIPVRVDTPVPKLAIFSCIDILPESELTFDYGSNVLPTECVMSAQERSNRKKCLCNSQNCRGWMPFEVY